MEQVEIHIKGQIDQNWSDWLSGLSIAHEKNDTVLKGLVADQSALYGVLFQLSDLGIAANFSNFNCGISGKNLEMN